MIYIDNRVGSKELHPLFPKGTATLTHLEYADFMFMGHSDGEDILIGVERKRIGDFINSMCTGRLSGKQLIGMVNSYHYLYLVIEGIFRANPQNGLLETWHSGGWQEYRAGKRLFMARDIWTFMNTLQVVCGLHCYHCPRETDTVQYIMALHHWWHKEYDEHKSHLQLHTGNVVQLSKASLVRRVAYQIDGIGWSKKSKAIDQHFKSVSELVEAVPMDFMKLEGIGKKLAGSIHKQLHGGK